MGAQTAGAKNNDIAMMSEQTAGHNVIKAGKNAKFPWNVVKNVVKM